MMQLYWAPRSRSFSALWLMEEAGKPYERVLIDISKGAQKSPEYLAINPMGKVPALKDGDATLAEAAAICTYVAERYPDSKLAAAARRSPAREISLLAVFRAKLHRAGDGAAGNQNRDEPGRRRLGRCATRVRCARYCARERTVDSRRGLLAADIAIGSALNFAVRLFKMVPTRPSFDSYIGRCMARPAFQRAEKIAAGSRLRESFPDWLSLGRRGGPRPLSSRRRRCQIRTGEGIGSCILQDLPVRRAFPWKASAIVATPPPGLRAKAPSRRV
jgi:glutathione S-transferase